MKFILLFLAFFSFLAILRFIGKPALTDIWTAFRPYLVPLLASLALVITLIALAFSGASLRVL